MYAYMNVYLLIFYWLCILSLEESFTKMAFTFEEIFSSNFADALDSLLEIILILFAFFGEISLKTT